MIQGSRAQRSFDSSPGLIAVFHALHRLPAPRHPPHALGSLAAPTLPPPRREPGRHFPTVPALGGRRNDPSLIQGSCRESQETKPVRHAARTQPCDMQLLPLPELSKNHTWLRDRPIPKGFTASRHWPGVEPPASDPTRSQPHQLLLDYRNLKKPSSV